ncbi:MAG: hypothetical protein ACXVJP_01595 [Mucilaginibacter sp.]
MKPASAGAWRKYAGLYVGKTIAEGEITVAGEKHVGQMDVIFIPYSKARIFVERAAVFVVRVARPEFSQTERGPRLLGRVEVMERIRQSLPLVGLPQICLPRPLQRAQQQWVKISKVPLPAGWLPEDPVLVVAGIEFVFARHDWLPTFAVENQIQRMIVSGLRKFARINAAAITENAGGARYLLSSAVHQAFKPSYFNPRMKAETLLGIDQHFLKYAERRYTKLTFSAGGGNRGNG